MCILQKNIGDNMRDVNADVKNTRVRVKTIEVVELTDYNDFVNHGKCSIDLIKERGSHEIYENQNIVIKQDGAKFHATVKGNKLVKTKPYSPLGIKPKNSESFRQISQIEDGIFIDDQHQTQIQQLIEDNYKILNLTNNGSLDYTPEYQIPMDKYFFMGDNRDNSSDSRVMSGVGFVPKVNIIGKVWFIWFSIDTKFSLTKFWTLPFHIRYNRLFKLVK